MLIDQFESDKKECVLIKLEDWKSRKTIQDLKQSVCGLLAQLL